MKVADGGVRTIPLALARFAAPACRMRRLLPFLLLAAAPASAQAPADARHSMIDQLLAALKSAPTEQAAAPLELRITQLWLQAGSPAVTLLMGRGLREMKGGAEQDAVEDFGDAIVLDPGVAEAYHQRAIARYAAGDTAGAIADIEAALAHEPRDFAALRTLTDISVARQDWKGAYAAWQKVLEIDPKTPGGDDRLKDLRRRALGEET